MDMDTVARIDDHLHRSFEGASWYGPSLAGLLADIPAPDAAARPIPPAHSIWEIVLHLTTWYTIVRLRLEGLAADASPAEDWPAVADTGEEAWVRACGRLRRSYLELRAALGRLDAERLADPAPGRDVTIDVMLRGVAEHAAYHAGQIALLKKALAARSA